MLKPFCLSGARATGADPLHCRSHRPGLPPESRGAGSLLGPGFGGLRLRAWGFRGLGFKGLGLGGLGVRVLGCWA